MKPSKYTTLTLVLVLLAIGLIYLIKFNLAEKTAAGKINNTTLEHSKYEGVDIKSNIRDEDTFHSAVHFPVFQKDSLNKKIEKYIIDVQNTFDHDVEIENPKRLKKTPATLLLSFEIFKGCEDLYSIVFTEESFINGANGHSNTKVFIVDTREGKFIDQKLLFTNFKENKKQLFQILDRQFRSSIEIRGYYFDEALYEHIVQNNDISNMYLTDKGIHFKFGKYLVTAGAAGMPEITVTWGEVCELLGKEWKNRLKVKDEPKPNSAKQPPGRKENEQNNLKDNQHIQDSATKQPAKKVALTFDDGPHPVNTPKILEMLKMYDAKATFFMLGSRVDFYPDIAKQIAQEGHQLGNHTWDHRDMTTLAPIEVQDEIQKTNNAIAAATGTPSTVYRPPYGAVNDQVKNSAGGEPVLWTVDTLDWKSKNPEQILSIVKANTQNNSIILMHDIHPTTASALEKVLEFLKTEGYEFVTVSELS
ncbi:polysaccharide deacetylase family protein [Bacillus massilinigeriensis]|uniref:polysaccharide deacetylase family protein n=1 Tax=Bacillus mediterraneensis TaxID=1805474 RepID=UPI0008F8714D|nr:polysaccharide deacetylase family protein [Bacillus mediterraneensis]